MYTVVTSSVNYLETVMCALQKLNKDKYMPGVYICILFSWGIIIEENIGDTKGVMRSRKSKKNKQYNGQKKKDKGKYKNLQNTTLY
jgi:hypothetical protein